MRVTTTTWKVDFGVILNFDLKKVKVLKIPTTNFILKLPVSVDPARLQDQLKQYLWVEDIWYSKWRKT